MNKKTPSIIGAAVGLALFLAIGKRRQELIMLADNAQNHRETYKDYNMALLDDMLRVVTIGSVLTYMLYTIEAPTIRTTGHYMMLTVPFVVYGVFRYLYLIHVKGEGSAPDDLVGVADGVGGAGGAAEGAEVGEGVDRHSAGGTCTKDQGKADYEGERKAQSHGSPLKATIRLNWLPRSSHYILTIWNAFLP